MHVSHIVYISMYIYIYNIYIYIYIITIIVKLLYRLYLQNKIKLRGATNEII